MFLTDTLLDRKNTVPSMLLIQVQFHTPVSSGVRIVALNSLDESCFSIFSFLVDNPTNDPLAGTEIAANGALQVWSSPICK